MGLCKKDRIPDCDCPRLTNVYVADEHNNYEATNGIKKFIEKYRKPKMFRSGFEQCLQENKIQHKLIRPRTPQLNGKVEQFNQTLWSL